MSGSWANANTQERAAIAGTNSTRQKTERALSCMNRPPCTVLMLSARIKDCKNKINAVAHEADSGVQERL